MVAVSSEVSLSCGTVVVVLWVFVSNMSLTVMTVTLHYGFVVVKLSGIVEWTCLVLVSAGSVVISVLRLRTGRVVTCSLVCVLLVWM